MIEWSGDKEVMKSKSKGEEEGKIWLAKKFR